MFTTRSSPCTEISPELPTSFHPDPLHFLFPGLSSLELPDSYIQLLIGHLHLDGYQASETSATAEPCALPPINLPSPGLHHLREWHHAPPQCSNQKHTRHPWSLFLSLHIPSIADSCWFQQTSSMYSRLSLVQGVHRRNLVLSPAKQIAQWVFSWFLFQLSNC